MGKFLAVMLLCVPTVALSQAPPTVNVTIQTPTKSNDAILHDIAQGPAAPGVPPMAVQLMNLRTAQQQQEMYRIQTEQQRLILDEMKRQAFAHRDVTLPAPATLFTGQVRVQETMTVSDFQRTGLQKLAPDELEALNGWLTQRLAEIAQAIKSQPLGESPQIHPNYSATSAAEAPTTKALLLFGGIDHKTFLGCLNCTKTDVASVCNEFGKYGSTYEADSIWNPYGTYGSEFNSSSPWNAFSTQAPIIANPDGTSYGYLSINEFHRDRTQTTWGLRLLDFQAKGKDLEKTRKQYCDE